MKAKKIGIIGKKLGMTQLFTPEGMVGVTVVDFSEMQVIGKRTEDKDGYNAIILGTNFKSDEMPNVVREIRTENFGAYDTEEGIMSALEGLSKVDVFGSIKGRGFQGGMKRHGFHGGRATHGAKHWHRRIGSIGGHSYPAKVWKGQKMPGQYGNTKKAVLNLKVIRIDKDRRVLFLKGAVPGFKNSIVMVRDAIKEN